MSQATTAEQLETMRHAIHALAFNLELALRLACHPEVQTQETFQLAIGELREMRETMSELGQ